MSTIFSVTRRAALAGLAASGVVASGLARPARAAQAKILRFIPQSDLASIDPIWTTAYVVRNHGYLVYDTLYATDSAFRVRPQMAAGHDISADGLTWTIRLRDGLTWHDGAPVRAADCIASIRRWAARDGFGLTLMAQVNELSAVDDRTIRFRLKSPFPRLDQALGKLSSPVPFMMPERVAATDPTQQIKDATGSGPFRFIPGAWMTGSHVAYARFDGYHPRDEAADGLAGGKVAHVDRVEWSIIPDSATQMSALRQQQVDWLEQPTSDLLPLIAHDRSIVTSTLDPIGTYVLLRFNALYPPFDNVDARAAVLASVDQTEYLQAMVGDGGSYRTCQAFFPCGTPLSTGAGHEAMTDNLARGKELLAKSGYDGRKVVVLSPSDIGYLAALGEVTADLLRKLGMNVDLVQTDWASIVARRASQKPPAEGGWNIFHTTAIATEFMSPASHLALRGNGRAGWAGWFTDDKLESLRADWFKAPDEAAEKSIAATMEREAFATVPYVPLGQYRQATSYWNTITNIIPAGAPLFWNLLKA
jgi:peptide/nickel transport system substrate-binding protein